MNICSGVTWIEQRESPKTYLLSLFSVFFSTSVGLTIHESSPLVTIENTFFVQVSTQLGPFPRFLSTSSLVYLEVFFQALPSPSLLQVNLHLCIFSHPPQLILPIHWLNWSHNSTCLKFLTGDSQLGKPPPCIVAYNDLRPASGLLASLLRCMFQLLTIEQSVHMSCTLRLY